VNQELNFEGKFVLVTGGSRGIGRAICEGFLKKGACVFICGRKEEALKEAAGYFRAFEGRFFPFQCNVTKPDEVDGLFQRIREKTDRLDVLVNNVGMNRFTAFVLDVEEGLWDRILQGNLKHAFLVTKGAFPLLKKAERGRVINISSIAGRKASFGMGVYCVAKAGLDMLTKVLAAELASFNINVNAVAPGMVRTDFSKPLWSQKDLLKEIEATIPMGRIGEVEEVVGAVLFLASPMADYITGEIITVDGGAQVR